jgi:hypothetical protein
MRRADALTSIGFTLAGSGVDQMGTASECRIRPMRVPATTFVITRWKFKSEKWRRTSLQLVRRAIERGSGARSNNAHTNVSSAAAVISRSWLCHRANASITSPIRPRSVQDSPVHVLPFVYIGERIRRRRAVLRLTPGELGRRLGVTSKTVVACVLRHGSGVRAAHRRWPRSPSRATRCSRHRRRRAARHGGRWPRRRGGRARCRRCRESR